MKELLFLFTTMLGPFSFSATPPDALWKKHCQQVASDPGIFLKKLLLAQNKISFVNHGGLFNDGVCWWHSRLTRIVQYLAVFDPFRAKPNEDEAYALIKRLREGRATIIPGFSNFLEFSNVHNRQIQENLETWQISDGAFGLGFLEGLMGSDKVEPSELRVLMDEAYSELSHNSRPIFQVLQLPGLKAHAWLLIGMTPTQSGYILDVVDSNYLSNQKWYYQDGLASFYYGNSPFVNYTSYRGRIEEKLISDRLGDVCSSLETSSQIRESPLTLDEELDLVMKSPVR